MQIMNSEMLLDLLNQQLVLCFMRIFLGFHWFYPMHTEKFQALTKAWITSQEARRPNRMPLNTSAPNHLLETNLEKILHQINQIT